MMYNEAIMILKKIDECGYSGFIVGGYVRDSLLKTNSNDIDICTNMPIKEFEKYYDIDKSSEEFGSFILKYNSNLNFEITLFRKDLSYDINRLPTIQLVNTYKEDYIRRDFTINSIGLDCNLSYVDYCNGIGDLKNKLIKTIRDANETFSEDPLRILRAIYFKNKLNFDYEENTYNALVDNVSKLANLNKLRVLSELDKMCKVNFNLFLGDLVSTNAYKYLPFKEEITLIKKKNIRVESALDLLTIGVVLMNSLYYWDIPRPQKKYINEVADLVKSNFDLRKIYECDIEQLEYAIYIYYLLYNKDIKFEITKTREKLPIKCNSDIRFKFKDIHNYVTDPKKIKIIKDLVIDNILNRKLLNSTEDITNFIVSKSKDML